MEVTDAAEALLDARRARRLIMLELADVELPTVSRHLPGRGGEANVLRRSEVVFVRLTAEADVLTVELWAQGLLTGERRIRVAGTEEHQARRVALASAELARRVRDARLLERQRVLREHLFPSTANGVSSHAIAVTLSSAVSMRTVWLPSVGTALVGPRVALWGQTQQGVGLGVEGAYYHAADSDGIRFWSELGLRPSWAFTLYGGWRLSIGSHVAIALVDVGNRSTVRGSPESQQTWSSRVALDALFTYRLAPQTNLMFGPDAGLQLRDVELQPRELGPRRVSGLWLGVGLGAQWYL